jgi:hypothetical protein
MYLDMMCQFCPCLFLHRGSFFYTVDTNVVSLEGGAVPANAGVTAGDVCCSFDGNESSLLLCCDGPRGHCQ